MKNKQPKMTRRERERRIIAEMEAAILEEKFPEGKTEQPAKESARVQAQAPRQEKKQKGTEPKLHCPRCKTVMENGKCPTCGHYIYVPMDKERRKKIRWIVGGVCVIGFAILFVVMQMKK